MKSTKVFFSFALVTTLILSSCKAVSTPDFIKRGVIEKPVRDTLYLNLPGCEDEWVELKILGNANRFYGRDQVVGGKVWFDIHRLPTGYYTAWIEFGAYSLTESFYHEQGLIMP